MLYICMFNKAKSQLFQSIMNFKISKIAWILPASQPATVILLSFLSLLSPLSIGIRKQFQRDHAQHSIQGVSRNNDASCCFILQTTL